MMTNIQKESAAMVANELMRSLAVAAAEAYEIGAEVDSDEMLVFTGAICLIGKTLGIDHAADDALDELDALMKKIDEVSAKPDYAEQDIFAERAVLAGGQNDNGRRIMLALEETSALLEQEQDKATVEKVISYIADFWGAQS